MAEVGEKPRRGVLGLAARPGRGGHLVRASIVGAIAGFVAVGFQWSLAFSEEARAGVLQRLQDAPASQWWGWAVLPVTGFVIGCFVGFLVQRFAPDAPGSGVPHVKGVLLHVRNIQWKALLPVKFLGGCLGIGAGLSLGREGPTVQMGATVGEMVSRAIGLSPRLTPQLISCGAGAGLAAAFNAPLAGFLFVLEELHREMSALTFGGALVATLTADVIARSLRGQLPSFAVHGYPALPLTAIPLVLVIGIAGGLLGVLFNKLLLWSQRRAQAATSVPAWIKPGIAAAICGLVAWWMPIAVGGGHSTAESLLNNHMQGAFGLLIALLFVKFALTVISYASGAPGGIFAPMLLIGAILGALLGEGVSAAWPAWSHHTAAFAVIGMAAMFTGSVRAPLTAMVLILEMTSNYQQLLALGIACLAAYLTAEALRDRPIYEALLADDLRRRGINSGQEGDPPRSVVMGIQRGSDLEGKSLRTSALPPGCLIVSVERGGREILPRADLMLAPGDHITVLVPAHETTKALQIVEMARQRD